MDILKIILDWGPILFGIIGLIATILKVYSVWVNIRVLEWKSLEKYTKKVIKSMAKENYEPDMIVGIGRGGAILASLLSGNMVRKNTKKNITIYCIDRIYKWEDDHRTEVENPYIQYEIFEGLHILLVAGDVVSGKTMTFYLEKLKEHHITSIKTATIVKSVGATFIPNFVGKKITSKFKMPWMYKGYARDSRKEIK